MSGFFCTFVGEIRYDTSLHFAKLCCIVYSFKFNHLKLKKTPEQPDGIHPPSHSGRDALRGREGVGKETKIMSGIVQYLTYQDNRKNIGTGKFYARAVHTTVIDSDQLAERIQRNCTVKKSDVYAVLIELAEVMKDELQNSNRVKIDNFGTFYLNLKSTGAESEDKFTVAENIVGCKVRFLPEHTKDAATGVYTVPFTQGVKFQKATGFVKA